MPTPSQQLREYMTELSRKYFDEDWYDGLEYALWEWMKTGVGMEAAEIFKLDNLSDHAGIWCADDRDWDLVDWQIHFEIGDW